MPRVLIADDIESNRYMLRTLLVGHGFEVVEANDGEQAWRLAQEDPRPELVVSDLLMPILDGFELCRRCKSDPRLSSVPFLVYTATYTDARDEKLVLALGADGFLVKPQLPHDLMRTVRELLAAGHVPRAPGHTDAEQRDLLLAHNDALVRKLQHKVDQLQREIRRREETETALRTSERRFRLLAENARDVVWSISLDGRLTYLSPSAHELHGVAPAELLTQPLDAFLSPGVAGAVRAELEGLRSDLAAEGDSRRTGTWEFGLSRPDGTRAHVEARFGVLRDDDGKVVGLQGVSRDVTSQRALQERLSQSQRLESIGRLAGGVAHDFNNLLSVILSYTSFVLERVPAPLGDDLSEVQRAGERAAVLTRQLLAFSRGQALSAEVLNLNQVVEGVAVLLRRLVGDQIELVCRLAEPLGNARVDAAQIEQVLMNLVVNARDAMPDGGRVCIETADEILDGTAVAGHALPAGRYVRLTVADSGHGIERQAMAHVFEPFFTTKEAGKGTGLGLSIVHGIVRQSGGDVLVHSELGRGTRFDVYLPQVDAPVCPSVRVAESGGGGRGERILVVDDEAAIRSMVVRLLRDAGYAVDDACDAAEAERVAALLETPVDLLLSDLVMPGARGGELAKSLCALWPTLAIVFMSGYSAPSGLTGDDADAWLRGRARFIAKPFSAEDLRCVVRRALDERAVGAGA